MKPYFEDNLKANRPLDDSPLFAAVCEKEHGCVVCQSAMHTLQLYGRVYTLKGHARWHSDHIGCGWIALYNARRLLGERCVPSAVVRATEKAAVLGGLLGVNPFALRGLLQKAGYSARFVPVRGFATSETGQKAVYIALSMHRRGLHYVAFRSAGEGLWHFYNDLQGEPRDLRPFAAFHRKGNRVLLLLRVSWPQEAPA